VTASGYSDRHYGGEHYEGEPPVTPTGFPRRRRRRARRWIIALIVLLGLLVAADRVTAAVTESRLAAKIQQSQHLSKKPSVSIDGFPFLTQVISRNFGHATVDISDLDAQGVLISHIHADLRGVHVSSGYDRATVDSLTSTATLTYAEVSTTLTKDAGIGQVQVSQGGATNQVKAAYRLLGIDVSADVDVSVHSGNILEFRAVKLHTPAGSVGLDANLFDVKVPISGLPFGMQLSGLQVTSTGVDIAATGKNVLLTGSAVSLPN
jgi:LmeA-like phospholipid-binding